MARLTGHNRRTQADLSLVIRHGDLLQRQVDRRTETPERQRAGNPRMFTFRIGYREACARERHRVELARRLCRESCLAQA